MVSHTLHFRYNGKIFLLVNSLLRKSPLNVLVSSEELFYVYINTASFTPFSPTHLISLMELTLDALANDLFTSG